MNKDNFFIAIGPPKTGTSWLYGVLNEHPEVEIPRDKEIRYFWAKEYLGRNNAITNLFGKHWHYDAKRRKSLPIIKRSIKQFLKGKPLDKASFRWHFRYFFYTQNNKWYESLFPKHKLSCDITPKYCELSEEYIKEIKALIPNCKIIISLRDPVDREWSRVKMNMVKRKGKKGIEEVDREAVLSHFENPLQHESNDYSQLIEKWGKYFDEDHTMIFYYDELVEDPQSLFDKVCHFLNIETVTLEHANKKFNQGIVQDIPDSYRDILLDLNYKFIEKFASDYPNRFSLDWLGKYQKVLPEDQEPIQS